VDHEVQNLNLDYLLGTMELDGRGVRIEHDQPLRTFLTILPGTAPCEEPDACAFNECEAAAIGDGVSIPAAESTGVGEQELPRPSPAPRQIDGPGLQGPVSTPPGPELLPPPSAPSLEPTK